MWKPLDSTFVTTKQKILCECQCGRRNEVRVRELLDGKSRCCRSCSSKLKMAAVPIEERVRLAKNASVAAAIALTKKVDPYETKYGEALKVILNLGAGAKQRCTNPNSIAYSNYGGRGIQFKFPNIRSFAEWVLDNLDTRPTLFHSIDRIDNEKHYEAGNLRWASRSEQARNKRVYKRTKNGERIRYLKDLRPDLTYETLRLWIIQGVTDEEIIERRKYARPSL